MTPLDVAKKYYIKEVVKVLLEFEETKKRKVEEEELKRSEEERKRKRKVEEMKRNMEEMEKKEKTKSNIQG